MSLLLQALQKAAKSRDDGEGEDATKPLQNTELALEPISDPKIGQETISPREPALTTGAAQAATVLRAAETPSYTPVDWMRDHYMLSFIGAAIVFAVCYGTYVYIQVANPSFLRRSAPIVRAPIQTAVAPAATAADTKTKISGIPDEMSSFPSGATTPAAEKPPAAKPVSREESPPVIAATSGPKPTTQSRPKTRTKASPAVASASVTADPSTASGARDEDSVEVIEIPDSPTIAPVSAPKAPREEISVSRQAATVQPVNSVLLAAYQALQQEDYPKSRTLYSEVLAEEPGNIDALLGMAAIAWKQGRIDEAGRHYSHVLELDPRNTHAQAGLIAMLGSADPLAAESRLKQLIGRDPSGFLYFTLGNLYAEQGQWPSAQQAYFQAYQFQPENPDYAFNLAIGLEHLGQTNLALDYYRKALDLSFKKGRANFDQSLAIERVGQLSARAR